ncbi:proline dehydrogenase family protein [Pedobacter glucosidilyticus]|uniref:proline dehydrogenase family protein n=1 Tax=Pedobacter glucosidilyticus TaxID=1122941 RepID=UPI0026F1D9C5|nr:proline dehydrogenase family protein [Pedobacter glucosidilyticus]
MMMNKRVSFNDTAIAFSHKTDKELAQAHFIFSLMKFQWLVKIGTKLTPLALKWKLPIKGLLRHTIFKIFIGGESLEETKKVLTTLNQYQVKVILDYGAEGKENEESFTKTCNEFISLIQYAGKQSSAPFISIKVTGLARFSFLEKLNIIIKQHPFTLPNPKALTPAEQQELELLLNKITAIVEAAKQEHIGVLVDAEETWIQDTIDALTFHFAKLYNQQNAVIFNTIQFYRTAAFDLLQESIRLAQEHQFIVGIKMVRGAYMEKERLRAQEYDYTSPIHATKQVTDDAFNKGLAYAIANLEKIHLIIASHNEESNSYATELLAQYGFAQQHPHIHFSQLYGMSDHITFNLAKAGYATSKYLPYGPIDDVVPYLMRRAEENTSVAGQTSRELQLIEQEIKRRKS